MHLNSKTGMGHSHACLHSYLRSVSNYRMKRKFAVATVSVSFFGADDKECSFKEQCGRNLESWNSGNIRSSAVQHHVPICLCHEFHRSHQTLRCCYRYAVPVCLTPTSKLSRTYHYLNIPLERLRISPSKRLAVALVQH